jgi:hypothetical protein
MEKMHMANLNPDERAKLNTLIGEMGSEDNTEYIRREKNSIKIRDDVRRIGVLRTEHADMVANDFQQFTELCQTECPFLFNNYTNIFNKIVKDEIDLTIMTKFLVVLKLIEDEKVDQHEGSVMIGKILKELYLDSAIRTADNLDKKIEGETVKPIEGKPITWKEYKKLN